VDVTAWKDLERRVCRALGGQRRGQVEGGRGWARGSDDDGSTPFAVEVKRTTRYQLRRAWIDQARRSADERPWLLVIAEHRDRRPIAVLDFGELVVLGREAGRIPEVADPTRVERLRSAIGDCAANVDPEEQLQIVLDMIDPAERAARVPLTPETLERADFG
jgi:hypothetical protein